MQGLQLAKEVRFSEGTIPTRWIHGDDTGAERETQTKTARLGRRSDIPQTSAGYTFLVA